MTYPVQGREQYQEGETALAKPHFQPSRKPKCCQSLPAGRLRPQSKGGRLPSSAPIERGGRQTGRLGLPSALSLTSDDADADADDDDDVSCTRLVIVLGW